MPRPRPPHLRHEKTRHGKRVWYVRIGGRRIRLKADYGTDEFWLQYHAAVNGTLPASRASKARSGSLAWLIERYRETTAWMDLSPATRRNRENHFKQITKSAGHQPYRAITQAVIAAGRDRRSATPAQARNFLDAMPAFSSGRKQRSTFL